MDLFYNSPKMFLILVSHHHHHDVREPKSDMNVDIQSCEILTASSASIELASSATCSIRKRAVCLWVKGSWVKVALSASDITWVSCATADEVAGLISDTGQGRRKVKEYGYTHVPYPHAHQVPPEGHEGEKSCRAVRLADILYVEAVQQSSSSSASIQRRRAIC